MAKRLIRIKNTKYLLKSKITEFKIINYLISVKKMTA